MVANKFYLLTHDNFEPSAGRVSCSFHNNILLHNCINGSFSLAVVAAFETSLLKNGIKIFRLFILSATASVYSQSGDVMQIQCHIL